MPTSNRPPQLDARLAAALAYVRPGSVAADIGCDHGKLTANLVGSQRCPLVFACDLREGPLQKARATCAPWGEKVVFRRGDGLSVLAPEEAQDIIIAGMGAETILEILDGAPWCFDEKYNFVFIPATKHSVLRQGLWRRGFALLEETLCTAAGRRYAVMKVRYTGEKREPTGRECLCGKIEGQDGAAAYLAEQCAKLKKYRRGLVGEERREEAAAVDALRLELEADYGCDSI